MRLSSLALVLAACQLTPVPTVQSPPPAWFELSSDPWIAGERTTIRAAGLPVNTRVELGIGAGGLEPGLCPPSLQGLCLDIGAPLFLLGSARVDATGEATWTLPVPAPRPGDYGALQAVAFLGGVPQLSTPVPVWIHEAGTMLTPAVDLDGDGFSPAQGDCYDNDTTVSPGALDVFGDGRDTNCDGVDGYVDADEDGFGTDVDCDDANPAVHPGVPEVCDGIDQDCDGLPDQGVPNDGAGCQDPGPPVYDDVVETVTVTVRTDTINNAGTNTNVVSACVSPSTCLRLGMDNWDDLEEGAIEVHAEEGLALARADVDRVELTTTNGPDAWRPACVSVALDGELAACSLPAVWIGTDPTDTSTWTDSILDLECGGCFPTALTHGPMLGAAESTSARVWWRTEYTRRTVLRVGPAGSDPAAAPVVAVRYPSPLEDFATEVEVSGLEPDTTYVFAVEVDGVVEATGELATAPEAASQFRFAFGSCARDEDQSTFGLIDAMDPDLMLMIGDNHYGNTAEVDALRQFYRWSRERPERAALGQNTPMIATWDDHDFTGNNTDGFAPGKENASRVFQEYWANRARPAAPDPAVYSSYSYGDVDFFLVDVRYHREVEGTFLGAAQTAWLLNGLRNSEATFKVVASGSQFTFEGSSDSWSNYPEDLTEVFETIAAEDVGGVVMLSGDVHRSEFRALGGSTDGYTVPELTSSPLANSNSTCTPSNELLACHDASNSFIVVDIDTTAADPTLTARMHDGTGTEIHQWTILRSELDPQPTQPAPRGLDRDVNGDGLGDLVLGVPGQSSAAGSVAFLRGSTSGPQAGGNQLVSQDSGTISGSSEAGDGLGTALALGDVNGDGHQDVICGIPNEAIGTEVDSGYLQVYFGDDGGIAEEGDQSLTNNGLGGVVAAGDELGFAVASGDLDNDGFDDVVAGLPGQDTIVVLFGSAAGLGDVQRYTAADFGIADGRFGAALAVGDFNNDGLDDVAVGAPLATANGVAEAGAVGLAMSGGRTFTLSQVDQSSPGVPGGTELGDHFGAVLATGDLDGDGFVDLAVGIPEEDIESNADSGMVSVFGGSAAGIDWSDNASPTMNSLPQSLGAGDRLGAALAIGDLDGDGRAELAIGAPQRVVDGQANAGMVVVVPGADLLDLAGAVTVVQSDLIDSVAGADHLFSFALGMGDYNGDGLADLTIGAPGTVIDGKLGAGAVGVVLGGASWRADMRTQRWHQDLDSVATATGTNERFGASLP